jgi:hypothetical protein
MRELYGQLTGTQMRPVRIVTDAGAGQAQFGGYPPPGVRPRRVVAETQYFLTLPLTEAVDVSVFLSLNYEDRESPRWLFRHYYTLFSEERELVQFVLHESRLEVAEDSELRSEFFRFGLSQGPLSTDPEVSTVHDLRMHDDAIYADHKTGGIPYFHQLVRTLPQQSLESLRMGYRHLLQLCSPGYEDPTIKGTWPFGESIFHIFGKPGPNEAGWSFLYGWG